MLSEKGISKLLDAKNPDELKLWADKVYQLLTAIKQLTIPEAATVSIQRGTIAVSSGGTTGAKSAADTITAVNLERTKCRYLGCESTLETVFSTARVELTDETTVTAYAYSQTNNSGTITVGYEVETE